MESHDPLLPNPAQSASCFAKYLTFGWLNSFFKKGSKRALEVSDMYEVLPDDDAKHLTSKLQHLWQKEMKAAAQENRRPALWRAIRAFLGIRFLFVGVLSLGEELGRIAQPVLVGIFLTYFNPVPGITHLQVYLCGLALLTMTLFPVLLHNPVFFKALRFGMQLRVAVTGLVYQKAVRVSHATLGKITTGHIINVLTSDVQKLENITIFSNFLWVTPVLVIIASYLAWQELGAACFPGIALLVCLGPFQIWLGGYFSRLRRKSAGLSDERINLMNEVISGMRVIKMYTWEEPFAKLVAHIRSRECKVIKRNAYLRGMNGALTFALMPLVSLLVFTTYVMTGHHLTPKKVFVVVGVFHTIRALVTIFFPYGIRNLKEGFVSEARIQDFLEMDEKAPSQTFKKLSIVPKAEVPRVKVTNVTASWDGNLTTLEGINFEVNPGELLMVVGPVGCGKSSLLMALLGEIPLTSGNVSVKGRVGYASQQPWIFSGTVRENIVFGQDFDEARYWKVVAACALKKDMKLFPRGDSTLVGERGVSLSGGQKARINLARAAYYNLAEVFLLDDPLSAVDMHVGKQLFDECIRGLLRDKIVILVTHQLQYIQKATAVMCLNDGRCVGQGTYEELADSGLDIKSLISTTEGQDDAGLDPHIDKLREADRPKLLTQISKRSRAMSDMSIATSMETFDLPDEGPPEPEEEARTVGKVAWRVYADYLRHGGAVLVLVAVLVLMLGSQGLMIMADWWLAAWADAEEKRRFEQAQTNATVATVPRDLYISVYGSVVVAGFALTLVAVCLFYHVAVTASKSLHNAMFKRVLRAPIYFFDTNPIGRVLNRFSKDIFQLDDLLPDAGGDFFRLSIVALSILLLNVASMPYMLVVVVPVVGLFVYIRSYYLKTSREVKRLEASSRSPFYSHLSASISGLLSIRAFKAEDRFVEMYNYYQNFHTSAWFLFLSTSRWLAFRLDFLCFIFFTTAVLTSLILAEAGVPISAGLVGLCLIYAKMLTGMFQWCVRQSAEVENLMTSAERVMEYSNLELEAERHNEAEDPAEDWPPHGTIRAQRLCYAHHPSLPLVLRNVNFSIKAHEKVGVVGRTGAGKSSLIAALFRFAEPDGLVEIDGVTITDIGLHTLRSKISTIPQDPVLFSGSLRKNLDPFSEHQDQELWGVLEEVQLKEAVEELPSGLQTQLAEAGSNFSVGQRQLVCLARAILRHNKILVVDEATANVDLSTDSLIQETIRLKFKDCTVLTIAHRLNTIMDSDRVMVLDEGRLVEFDEPYILLQNKTSLFTQLVEQTNQSTAASLYEVARQAYELRRENATKNDAETTDDDNDDDDGVDDDVGEDDDRVLHRPPQLMVTTTESDNDHSISGSTEGDPLIEDEKSTEEHATSPVNDENRDENEITEVPEGDRPTESHDTGTDLSQDAPSTTDNHEGRPVSSEDSEVPDASEVDRLLDSEAGGDVSSPPQVTFTGEKSAAPEGPGAGGEHDDAEASETDQLIPSERCA